LLKESLLVLAIIILFCFLVWLLKDTPPISFAYAWAEPMIQQLQGIVGDLLAGPLGLWQQATAQQPWVDDAVKMGGTAALVKAVSHYTGTKAKAFLTSKLSKAETALKNHTSENETLKEANTQLQEKNETILSLTGELQSGYEAKLKTQQTEFEEYKKAKQAEVDKLIRERNAAERVDEDKIAEKVLEKVRKH